MVSYETTDLPVNHIMQMSQPDPSAVAGPVSSVVPVPTTPPPNYDSVSDALPPNYGPVPSVPPPTYEVII
ncbi:hypothetical protein G5714_007953 [Onychostoma macrolepis]|uniref:Uncharacterized protein n=1 Tax=Onychostoma macrolepis TaxID=369639 RepID=A0A7J6CYG4_9TELE|nr:hypothetical protein G5714_007953 [Onychostoma macrolepis]